MDSQVEGPTLDGRLLALMLSSGYEETLTSLLVLLLPVRVARDALVGALVPLGFPFRAVEDRSHRVLAGRVASGNIQELLGSARALAPELVDQGLIAGLGQEHANDVSVSDVRQLVALPRETSYVLS